MNRQSALSHLGPIEPRTRGVQVLDALAEMVEKAGLKIGDKLPTETSLATRLGVGRSTIREALNRWEGLGLIRRRPGSGTFLVANVPSSVGLVPMTIRLEGEAVLRLLEVRRALEGAVVRLAAIHANEEHRRNIAESCDALIAGVKAHKPWGDLDVRFHTAIYDASGNPMFGHLLHRLADALERSPDSPFGTPDFALKSFPMHIDLKDAILAGDPDAASAAINAILDSVSGEIRDLIGMPSSQARQPSATLGGM